MLKGKGESAPTGTIVFDLDGVIYLGDTPIPGAAGTIAELTERGWQLLFATNNSTKTPDSVCRMLRDKAGILVAPEAVVTSGMAVVTYLVAHSLRSAFVIGAPELKATIAEADIAITTHDPGPAVVVVGLDTRLTSAKIEHAARAIRGGAVFVATNTDATIPTPSGDSPGAGTMVAAVAEASRSTPIPCGKPHQPMLDLVASKIVAPVAMTSRALTDRVWMVGDRPETDIAFAKHAGWRSILTLSGVTKDPGKVPPHLTPDHVITSIADLPKILHHNAERFAGDER